MKRDSSMKVRTMQLSSLFKNELAIVTGGLIKFTLLSRVVLQFEIAPQPPPPTPQIIIIIIIMMMM
jgi:hypothetical protein